MATQYNEIYSFFLAKVSDYSLLEMTVAERESLLEDYLKIAITKFKKCKKDLGDRDETANQFNDTLSDEEKDIISKLMVVEYLRPSIIDAKHKKLMLTDSEFRMYSQANHIEKMMELYSLMREESKKDMAEYTWNGFGGDLNG